MNSTLTYELHPKIKKGDLTGLDNYGVSKFPGTSSFFFAKFDPIAKKYITGLDINAKTVLSIKDETKRKEEQKRISEIKESLENFLSSPNLLDPTSSFWDSFGVTVTTGQDLKTYIELDGKNYSLEPSNNPLHRLALIMLEANDYIPKTKEDSSNPKYKDSKFYLTTIEELDRESEAFVNDKVAVGVHLGELFGKKINYTRAFEIAYFLGLKPRKSISESLLKQMLFQYTETKAGMKSFIAACETENEVLIAKNLFKKGIALDVIKYNSSEKLYYRGGVNYRSTEEDSVKYLLTEAMNTEFAQLKEAVEKRAQTAKNLA